uniref:Uncharacterized protein n=1 Tax=viral metagenome TaxID=1070528 RepID=A0A6C0B5G3_9ZZZZ
MLMLKSRVKWAYYILIASALAYVGLMTLSLNNTREALTPSLTLWSDRASKTESTGTISSETTNDENAFTRDINTYRTKLDLRLKDLKSSTPDSLHDYNTTTYTSIVWAILVTVLLYVIFIEMEN